MEFHPWQPFDSCWEPDEGMLPELERDGMVAWAWRELFHADVQALLASDPERLRDLQTTERAKSYGYGPMRPLYLPEGLRLDGEAWVVSTLPDRVMAAAAAVDDPEALYQFELTIGREAELICRSYGGKTAHKVAHRLCNTEHPLHDALFTIVANDLGVWLEQEPELALRTPIGRLLDRGVMRALGERMRRIRSGLQLNPERLVPPDGGMPCPLLEEGPVEKVMRIALWGRNGLGHLLRTSMVEFLRERYFDLGSHWLFVCPEAGYKRAGLGYVLLDAFWEIVKGIDFAGFEPDRQDCWEWGFEPYGHSGAAQVLLSYRPSRADWGLLEAWVAQHRYQLATGNWEGVDLERLYGVLAAELSLSHNIADDTMDIGAEPVEWWAEHWQQWGVEHTNELHFDHDQRYRPMVAEPGSYEPQEGSWLMSQWVAPLLCGLMERMAQAYGNEGNQHDGFLASAPPAWGESMLRALAHPHSSVLRREAINGAMAAYSARPELLKRGTGLHKGVAGPSIVPVAEELSRVPISGWIKAELVLPAYGEPELEQLTAVSDSRYGGRRDSALLCIKRACAAGEIWAEASEVAGLNPIALLTLREALASELDINHPGYAKDLRAVLLERLTRVDGTCYRPSREGELIALKAALV